MKLLVQRLEDVERKHIENLLVDYIPYLADADIEKLLRKAQRDLVIMQAIAESLIKGAETEEAKERLVQRYGEHVNDLLGL